MHTVGRGRTLADRIAHIGIEAQALQMRSLEGASQGGGNAAGAFASGSSAQSDASGQREAALHFLQGIITAIAVILLLASLSKAHGESYSFRNYQQSEGLQNPNITRLLQDHSGLLWMGTEKRPVQVRWRQDQPRPDF